MQDTLGSYSSSFAYDDLNQITEESGLFENRYAFDSNNNRREKNGSKYSIDGLNQLTDDQTNIHMIKMAEEFLRETKYTHTMPSAD